MFQSIIKAVFFGNYFYGICAVALAIEASLQQNYSFNPPVFYVLVFTVTVWFYTLAYIKDPSIKTSRNPRTRWFIQYRVYVLYSQRLCLISSSIILLFFLYKYRVGLTGISKGQLWPLLLTPLAALLYYGLSFLGSFNLRRIGWLKPFIIGFTWAGLITLTPVVFYHISHQTNQSMSPTGWWLFLKNFMFVSVLCIMFDIKDYASDANHNIKTFVVAKGLRFTIFSIIVPLTLAGMASFLAFAIYNGFSVTRLLFNLIPFLAMILVAYALKQRRTIFFYLTVIDGLMFLKALCGILAYYFDSTHLR
ncbi:UbiA family prenyltransferase [Emticicia sp. TH156]|uniref:UbiA family prenyltransferase n=1 Tax=Emticicia sp. TH156 TaxID=2067454 RepID=UPI000C77D4A9|nr:UbiA family prenyltransferase [Emticicia sp. TH156]